MTQTDRVIAAARSYRGVSQVDFLGPVTVDGGPPITRLAARLYDAERQGFSFECIGWRDRCKCWRLVGEPDVESGSGDSSSDAESTLVGSQASLHREPGDSTPALSAEPTLFDMAEDTDTAHWRAA